MNIKIKIYLNIIRKCSKIYSTFRRYIYNLSPLISIGQGTYIERGAEIIPECKWGTGKIFIGNHCFIGNGVKIIAQGGDITIGDNTSINPYTIVYGMGGLRIGDNVRIGPQCTIVPQNHNYLCKSKLIREQGMTSIGVKIEDDVWVGANVVVLDGVTIRQGSVLGAGGVVTKDTDSYGVYIGNPAKLLKYRKDIGS